MGVGSKPNLRNCATTPGSFKVATNAAFKRLITSGEVLAGAANAYQLVASNPGKPDSAMVGTLGKASKRLEPVVAKGRSLPV